MISIFDLIAQKNGCSRRQVELAFVILKRSNCEEMAAPIAWNLLRIALKYRRFISDSKIAEDETK